MTAKKPRARRTKKNVVMHPLSELLCLSSFRVVTIRKPAPIAAMIKQKT